MDKPLSIIVISAIPIIFLILVAVLGYFVFKMQAVDDLLSFIMIFAVPIITSVAVLGCFILMSLLEDFRSIRDEMKLIKTAINKLDFSKVASNLVPLTPDAIGRAIHDAISAELKTLRETVPETPTLEEELRKEKVSTGMPDQQANHLRTPISEKGKTEEEILEETLKKIGSLYNDAVRDAGKKNNFMRDYHPIRIGVINAMDRRQDLSIEAVFQQANDGDYYAVLIRGNTGYAVVPRFDLTFEEFSYGPGAMGQVFDCPGFNPHNTYVDVRVEMPAVLKPGAGSNSWKLVRKGELGLKKGIGKLPEPVKPEMAETLQEICRLYNSAVEKPDERKQYIQRYSPVIQIGACDDNGKQAFKTFGVGDFYALCVEGSTIYAVVPSFTLVIDESNYSRRAIDQVFDCPNYDPEAKYSKVKVVKPATFELDLSKKEWELKNKGELDLLPTLGKVKRLYNAVINESIGQDEFKQRCKPISIAVVNATQREQDLNAESVFQTADDGDYYAVAVVGNENYVVVPLFGLVVDDSSYGPGAIGFVFDCLEYNSQASHICANLEEPATFEPDAVKQRWKIKKKGIIYLKEKPFELSETVKDIIDLYNQCIGNYDIQHLFRQRHEDRITQIEVANRDQRETDPDIEPKLRKATKPYSDYFALETEKNTYYAFLPSINLISNWADHSERTAVRLFFECPESKPNAKRLSIAVVKPAIFKKAESGDEWKLEEKGKLHYEEQSEKRGTKPAQPEPSEDQLQRIADDYNAAIDDESKKGEFKRRYKLDNVGVTSSRKEPVFEKSVISGNHYYYAVEIEKDKLYAFVPGFGLVLQGSEYEAGAVRRAFECPKFMPQLLYRHVKVKKPAIFECELDTGGEKKWKPKRRGELDLGEGEKKAESNQKQS